MYLSRMYLNPQRRGARSLLASPHEMHKAILSCFPPDGNEGLPGRVLWRVDQHAEKTTLYITSPSLPSFEHLQETAGWSNQVSWRSADYIPFLRKLEVGQRFAFSLAANPVHTVTEDGVKRRLPHVTAEYQLKWLLERQQQMGIQIPDLTSEVDQTIGVDARVTRREHLKFRRRQGNITLVRAYYGGNLVVRDPLKLRSVLMDGIGKAKGYGCGLLTLAPAGVE